MKICKNKLLKQMIIMITLIFVIINGIFPSQVYATKSNESLISDLFSKFKNTAATAIGFSTGLSGETEDWSPSGIFGNLLKELIYLVVAIGDVGMAAMQVMLLGDMSFWTSTMVSNKNDNLEDTNSWLYADQSDVDALQNGGTSSRGSMLVIASNDGLKNGLFQAHWKVPNMLYSPENIFANKIAALDANYINPHKYTAVNDSEESRKEATSFAESISPTIASWYRAFRNISIVGLLSVLVYIGIRILIGTVTEKAQYKERLFDWFVALCLVFFMHFIMAGIMMIVEKITDLFSNAINSGIIVTVDDGTIFRTSFTGYIRFAAQSDAWTEALGYGAMYLFIVGLTLKFTFIYMKRALYLAFFTMIAPLVAITYPIDKAGDGKAQAFNTWIKEYFINAILQPMHLILYCALVGAAMSLVVQNPIYGIVTLLFISTAEKWVKTMFKMDQAPLSKTTIGDVAMLGTMASMGTKIAGGFVGGARTIVKNARQGGIKAVGKGLVTSAVGTPVRLAGNVAGKVVSRINRPKGNGVEEEVKEKQIPEVDQNNLQFYKDMKEAGYNKQELAQLADDLNLTEYLKQKEKQELTSHTKDATSVLEGKPNPDSVGAGKNLDDISGVPEKETKESIKETKESTKDTIKLDNTSENKGDNDNKNSEYEQKMLNDIRAKKIVEKDSSEEIRDVLNKGLAGALGAVGGAAAGVVMSGVTGENKMIPTLALGGTDSAMKGQAGRIESRDSAVARNVKMLVKNDIQNNNIIKNAAELGNKRNWSEGQTLQVAKLAEAFPDLKADTKTQELIEQKWEEMGLSKKDIKRTVSDIIKVQSKSAPVDKKDKQEKEEKKKIDDLIIQLKQKEAKT